MSRTFAIAALAAALAAGPMLATEASAQNRRGEALAIGLAAGLGGVLIGSAIANAQPRYAPEPRFHAEPRFYRHVSHYDEPTCFRRPIQRIDSYTGEIVTIGTRLVCR